MPVRTRVVDGPIRSALPPVGMVRARIFAGVKAVLGGVHQARKRPFTGNLPVGGTREVFVLVAGIFAEGALGEGGANQEGSGEGTGNKETQTDEVVHRYS